jgi:D-sedoheptulose 7-phosphate isomerase
VAEKAADSIAVKQAFFEANRESVVTAAQGIAEVYRRQGRMFAMGNGGFSCDAAHFAVEFLHPITSGRPALSAINLTADVAMMSAVGNDAGFAHVFVRQLISLARRGDGLIGFSTSGNSANLIAAFAKARELGMTTIGIAGMDGGEMA